MIRIALMGGLAAGWLALCADRAEAQGTNFPNLQPPYQPAVSPYLNLARPNSSAALNYYNLVRPQLQFQGAIQNLQQQLNRNRGSITAVQTAVGRVTPPAAGGRQVRFLDTGGYFLNLSVRGPAQASIGQQFYPAGGPPAIRAPSVGGLDPR